MGLNEPGECIEEGCGLPILNKPRRLCSKHYQRLQRKGPLPPLPSKPVRHQALEARVLKRILWPSVMTACWPWAPPLDRHGYGVVSVDGTGQRAHRVVYELFVGPIPDGLVIDHLCRKPQCVNPMHLEPVTQEENMRRGESGWNTRAKTHCPQGHPYAGENLYINPTSGGRVCRTCTNEKARRYQQRKRSTK